MAELFRRPGVANWYAWIRDPRVEGGLVKRSTKCRVKSEARAVAETIQATVTAEIAALLAEPTGPTLYWSDAAKSFLSKAPLKQTTRHSYESLVNVVQTAFGDFAMAELTPRMVKDFVASRREQAVAVANDGRTVKDSTIRRNISFMSRVYGWHIDRETPGCPEVNPILLYNRRGLQESPLVDRNLRTEQFQAVIAACQTSQHRHIVTVLVGTGMRTGELIGMTWNEVDLVNGFIEFGNLDPDRAKTSHARRVGIGPFVVEALTAQSTAQKARGVYTPDGLVFRSPRGGGELANLQGLLRRIKRITGISLFTIHGLRSTFASWALQQDVDPIAIRDTIGHSTLAMTTRYAKHTSDTAAAKIRGIKFPVTAQSTAQIQRFSKGGASPISEIPSDIR